MAREIIRARQVATIERLMGHGDDAGVTYKYFVRPGSRSRPYVFFEVSDVPEFDGPSARFEIARVDKAWRVLRRIEEG